MNEKLNDQDEKQLNILLEEIIDFLKPNLEPLPKYEGGLRKGPVVLCYQLIPEYISKKEFLEDAEILWKHLTDIFENENKE